MKRLFLALVALSATYAAEAQIVSSTSKTITSHTTAETVVVPDEPTVYKNYNRFSLNYASLHYGDVELDSSTFPGFEVAWDHANNLSKGKKLPIYLEWGIHLQYNAKNISYGYWGYYEEETYRHLEIAIPFSVTYKFMLNDFYAAPFFGLHFKSACLDDLADDLESQKYFQMGYQVGANLGYKKLNFQIGYSGDFMPVCETWDDEGIKTGTFFVGLGVNF